MADTFQNFPPDFQTAPASNAVAVTPNDSADLAFASRGVFVGGAGNLAYIPLNGTTAVTLVGIPAGTILPIRPKRIMSTNTTATSIVSLW